MLSFSNTGMTVQRAAHLTRFALGVERISVGTGGGIDLDHRIQLRAGIVYLRNAIQVGVGQRARRECSRHHAIARLDGAQLDDVDGRLRRGWRLSCGVGRFRRSRAGDRLNGYQARDESTHQVLLNAFAMLFSARSTSFRDVARFIRMWFAPPRP